MSLIHDGIHDWANQQINRKISADQLQSELCIVFLGLDLPVDVVVEENLMMKPGFFAIGGELLFNENNLFRLRILLSDEDIQSGFIMTSKWVDMFAFELSEVAIHEYTHWWQEESREPDWVYTSCTAESSGYGNYLCNTDEIDAFSVSIAYHLNQTMPVSEAISLFRTPSTITPSHCIDLHEYVQTLRPDHPVLRKLFKKIIGKLNV